MQIDDHRTVIPLRTLAPWVGGKRQLGRMLARRIEAVPHDTYVDVFAGMGGVFFRRASAPRTEIVNDLNRDVANLFRILQNHYQAFMDMLRWQLTSRVEFERLNGMDADRLTDLQRAARFLYLQRTAFGGKVAHRSFGVSGGGARFDITKLGELLAATHERLAGVVIECLPWQTLIDRWDRPGTLFFLDPPYWGTEHYYGRGMFERGEYEALAARLKTIRGRFIMTLNDVPAVRETFAGFALEPVELSYTVGGNQAAKAVRELVITRRGQCAFDSRSGKPESPDCAVKNPKMRGALHTCLPMQRRVGVQGIDGSGGGI